MALAVQPSTATLSTRPPTPDHQNQPARVLHLTDSNRRPPPYTFRCARNYWRPEATDSACLGRFGRCRTCAGSPPFAPALLHKCAMLGRPARHPHLARRRRLGLLLGGASSERGGSRPTRRSPWRPPLPESPLR